MLASRLSLFALALLAGLLLLPVQPASAATTTVTPVADAYVSQTNPRAKFGTATELRVAAPISEQRSYLRFDVRGLAGPVTRATLKASPNTVGTAFDARRVADTTWNEKRITWNNAPPMTGGAPLATSALQSDGWVATDVTAAVTGNGLVSIGLTTANPAVVGLASREVAARAPRLVVETADPAPDTTPPLVTLVQPANGSSTAEPQPTFTGSAGTAQGDSSFVTTKVYAGTAVTGAPVQTLTAVRTIGSWSVAAGSPLSAGTYTAQAEQADSAGNVGRSSANTFTITTSSPPPAGYRAEVMADGPRGYWRLGEASGTTAVSETASNAGTYTGGVTLAQPGSIAGDPNSAARLDGLDDHVRVPSATSLGPTAALSLETWVRPATLPSDTATLVRKDGHYLLRVNASGALIFRVWKGGAMTELTTGSNLVRAGSWSHVVATVDGSTMTVYVDGLARASRSFVGPTDSSTSALYFGASSGSYDWLAGTIDEVAVYGAALTATRVRAHYDASGQTAAGPDVTLHSPSSGSTMDRTPTYAGFGGVGSGAAASVTVKVYSGSSASGTPVQTVTAAVQPAGTYSVKASSALPSGTYAAQAEQSGNGGALGRSAARTFTVDAGMPTTLLAAGDIAACDTTGDEATAELLDSLPGTVATLGDHVYEFGTEADFRDCYDVTWGRHKARTRPAVGDHEYLTPNATPYFNYFGAAAGDPAKGYYSYDLGSWHIVVTNATCEEAGGCGVGSAQEQWLRQDLAANTATCTLAVIPRPRFSSGAIHGNQADMQPFWQALYNDGAEVVLSGDDHVYERFAPQTPTGAADPVAGIREFVVGTGGRSHYAFGTIRPNSEVRNNDAFGVLRLSLRSGAYDWRFIPEAGKTFADSGSGSCH
jgi:acid phosphatase type 7